MARRGRAARAAVTTLLLLASLTLLANKASDCNGPEPEEPSPGEDVPDPDPDPDPGPEPDPDPAPGGVPDVPYFYQYANDLYPESTCQNTSVAMLLAYYGWRGEPDDITRQWGKDYAQSPSGLAAVFNSTAAAAGISERLHAHTSGTLAGFRALLADGIPVIVHGYFTGSGHVVVALDWDGSGYVVNDPAGRWNQRFMGGYPSGYAPTAGDHVRYGAAAFEAAVATSDGASYLPLWYHEVY